MLSATAVVVCALELLGRPSATVPQTIFLPAPPLGASPNVEAFALPAPDRIFLITSSAIFREAQEGDPRGCNRDPIRKIASIIVHEEWHLRHGSDERAAYQAQLTTLDALRASSAVIASVRLSMAAVLKAQKRRRPDLVIAREGE